jgi:DNA repair exonuclease SbcCD ATPase subunit
MKRIGIISAAVLSMLLGTASLAYPQQAPADEKKAQIEQQKQNKNKQQEQRAHQQQQDQNKQAEQQRAHQQQQLDRNRQYRQQDQNRRQAERLSQQRQQQVIEQQQQRLTQYRQHQEKQQQQGFERQREESLQHQGRNAQYHFEQDYQQRLRQQYEHIQNERNHDYQNDPYFYTAPSYRYRRGGTYYEVNEYAMDRLRDAVNNGYAEGFRTGEADREDRWPSNYRGAYAYQDANYGYDGIYLDQSSYNYYFREGFRRGYADGYSRRYRYGQYSGGNYSVSVGIMNGIFSFQAIR